MCLSILGRYFILWCLYVGKMDKMLNLWLLNFLPPVHPTPVRPYIYIHFLMPILFIYLKYFLIIIFYCLIKNVDEKSLSKSYFFYPFFFLLLHPRLTFVWFAPSSSVNYNIFHGIKFYDNYFDCCCFFCCCWNHEIFHKDFFSINILGMQRLSSIPDLIM